MAETLVRIASLLLGVAFGWAALAKVVSFREWRGALGRYGLTRLLEPAAAFGVPVVEAATAALLLLGSMELGAALALALISSFSLAVLRARALRGDRLPCGCFGRASVRDYRVMLARNALLGALAAVVIVGGPPDGLSPGMPSPGELVPAALALAGIAAGLWTARQAMASMRRGGHR
ncbi:MAG: MauE/DoxX family redox-associated membrane protein [Actinomycetota bacterium]